MDLTTSSRGRSKPLACSAAQVMGWPWESSGGEPAAREAMIFPSRSPHARASASTLISGCSFSNRATILATAFLDRGLVSVCHTLMTFSAARLVPPKIMKNRQTVPMITLYLFLRFIPKPPFLSRALCFAPRLCSRRKTKGRRAAQKSHFLPSFFFYHPLSLYFRVHLLSHKNSTVS